MKNWFLKKYLQGKIFIQELIEGEDGETNIVAIILLIIVIIALVAIFKDKMTKIIISLFDKIAQAVNGI